MADTNIYPLSPTLAPVNARCDAIDFQALTFDAIDFHVA